MREMREQLAEHLGVPRDGLEVWKEEIRELTKKVLGEHTVMSASASSDQGSQATQMLEDAPAEPPK